MKLKLLYIIICLLSFQSVHSQNLVPNPSFEDTIACPNGYMQTNKALGWIINVNSADYFHSCDHPPPATSFSTPLNSVGYQIPATGKAYCGLCNYCTNVLGDVREYIGTSLLSPLVIGKKYYVSFKASWADGLCASNNLGILFSNMFYGDTTSLCATILPPPLINDFAHVFNATLINDSINWTIINGSFIADSTYKYIYIGNFFSRMNTDTLITNGSSSVCCSYYFIDDVCVSPDSLECDFANTIDDIYTSIRDISVYPNPSNNILYISGFYLNELLDISLYNVLGEKQFYSTIKSENEIEIDISRLKPGTYILSLKIKNELYKKKIIKY